MSKQRAKKRAPNDPADPLADELADSRQPRLAQRRKPAKRRRLVVFSCVLLTIATVVLFLPALVTKTALPDRLLAKALPSKAGFLTMSSVSVGWWKPLHVRGLCLFDSAGELVMEVPQLRLDRGLLRLLYDRSQLGNLIIKDARLHVVLTETGSNLERLLEIVREANQDSDNESPRIQSFELLHAEFGVRDEVTGSSWRFQDLTAKAVHAEGWTASVSGLLDEQAFELNGSLKVPADESERPGESRYEGQISCKAERIPIALLQPVARRHDRSFSELKGALAIDSAVRWDLQGDQRDIEVGGRFDIHGLVLRGGPLAQNDNLRMESLHADAACRLVGGQLQIEQLGLESDFGSMSCRGELPIDQLFTPRAIQALADARLHSQGTLDLAALVAALPNTLHVQPNVSVPSGSLTWQVEGQPTNDAALWAGKFTTSGVHLLQSGQPIEWEPVELSFRVAVGQAFELNHLTFRSESIALRAEGDAEMGALDYQVDLDRLMRNASQVIDFGGSRVAGNLQGALRWQALQASQLEFHVDANLKDAAYIRLGRSVWQEPALRITSDARFTLAGRALRSLDDGDLQITATRDSCVLSIEQPFVLNADGPPARIRGELRGDLASWAERCGVLGGFSPPDVQGHILAKGVGQLERDRLRFESLDVTLRNLLVAAANYRFEEPVTRIVLTGAMQPSGMQVEHLTCTSPSLALVAKDSLVSWEDTVSVVANVGYRADLQRVFSSELNSFPHVRGTSVGQLEVHHASCVTDVRFHGRVDEFHARGASGNWREAKLTLRGDSRYDHLADRLNVRQLELSGDDLLVTAAGSVSRLSKRPVADVSGKYNSRLQKWVDVLGIPNQQVLLNGHTSQDFVIRGPIFSRGASWRVSRDLEIETGIGWDSAKLLGTPIAGQALQLQLRKGILHSSRFFTKLGDGQIAFSPRLNINALAPNITVAPGRVVDRVTITPEIARRWLKYATPLLADIATAEAKFSLDIEQATVPVPNPYAAQAVGRLAIHQGRVGPGSLTLQCVEVITQLKRLLGRGSGRVVNPDRLVIELPEQAVDLQVVQGRVYHERFVMVVDGIPVRTRGSVHMANESLSLIAEIALSGSLAPESRGDVISIPMGGTLSRPVLDRGALMEISRTLARNATGRYLRKELAGKVPGDVGERLGDLIGGDAKDLGDVLEDELGRQLKRLFK